MTGLCAGSVPVRVRVARAAAPVLVILGLSMASTVSVDAAPVSLPGTTSTTLPGSASLVRDLKEALSQVRSLHLLIVATQKSPKITETITENSAADAAEQHVVTGNKYASVILLPRAAYISGNNAGLTAFFAMPPDDIALVGGRWIAINAGSSQYQSFSSSITSKAAIETLEPTTSSVGISATRYGKIPAYRLTWTVSSSSGAIEVALLVPRTGRTLPLEETAVTSTTVEHSFPGRWNEPVDVKAPSRTVAISSLHTS